MNGVRVPKVWRITSSLVSVMVDWLSGMSFTCLMENTLMVFFGSLRCPSSTQRWMASAGPEYGLSLL